MGSAGRVLLQLDLEAEAAAPRLARNAVGDLLALHPLCADLVLCVSEAVTNAVLHARRGPVGLLVRSRGGRVRIEVSDGDPTAPRPQRPDPHTPTGRGLLLIEQLTERWGVDIRPTGKTVWFEVRT